MRYLYIKKELVFMNKVPLWEGLVIIRCLNKNAAFTLSLEESLCIARINVEKPSFSTRTVSASGKSLVRPIKENKNMKVLLLMACVHTANCNNLCIIISI